MLSEGPRPTEYLKREHLVHEIRVDIQIVPQCHPTDGLCLPRLLPLRLFEKLPNDRDIRLLPAHNPIRNDLEDIRGRQLVETVINGDRIRIHHVTHRRWRETQLIVHAESHLNVVPTLPSKRSIPVDL